MYRTVAGVAVVHSFHCHSPVRSRAPYDAIVAFVRVAAAVIIAIGIGVGVVGATTGGLDVTGAVTGSLLTIGGPPPGLPRPVAGPVTLTNVSSGARFTGSAGSDGHFAIVVPAGIYEVSANSPDIDGGRGVGSQDGPLRVRPGATTHENVYFSIR